MAPALFSYTLPTLQLVCHLVATGDPTIDTTSSSTIAPQSVTTARELPRGYIAYPDFGAAYRFNYERVSWNVARDRCAREGASLAQIDSTAKLQVVKDQQPGPEGSHVGFHLKNGDDITWYSVSTGLPVSNLPWGRGEPLGTGRCVKLIDSTSEIGLTKYHCTHLSPFVCQLPYP